MVRFEIFGNFEKSFKMINDTQIRNRLLRKILRIPTEKLKEIDDFVAKLEVPANKKQKNLSFAGSWEDMDNTLFEALTDNLISNRQRNRRRIDE